MKPVKYWYVFPNLGDIQELNFYEVPTELCLMFFSEEKAIEAFAGIMDRYCINPSVKKIWKRVRDV